MSSIYMDVYENLGVRRFESNLKNGIKVALYHKKNTPITTYSILKSGSSNDPETMPGVAHFIEHMIVNGSPEFPSKDLLAEHIESVGGSYSAKTGQDPMWVIAEVSDRSDYSRIVDILRATLCNPLMDRQVFENEKQVVIKEIERNNSNSAAVLTKGVRELFFKGTAFEHNVVGDEESISNLKYEDVLTEYSKLFDKSRITFVIAGDISIEEVTEHLNKLVFLEGNPILEIKNAPVSEQRKILANFLDVPQTYIYFGVPAPNVFTKEWSDLVLLSNILSGGRASRLMKRLRYKEGLVYTSGFLRQGGLKFGSWGITTDTTKDKTQKVIDEIIKEIKDIQENGIKESELEFIRNRSLKSLKRSMQTSDKWADFHALGEAYLLKPYSLNSYIEDIEKATVGSIKDVIDRFLGKEKWRLALSGKTKEEELVISW